MAKKPKPEPVTIIRDETVEIPQGETRYTMICCEDEIEQMASGRIGHRLQTAAWNMLRWKRTAAQDWASVQPSAKKKGG